MTKWRREEYEILSQSSHLSYIAAALTALSGKLGDEKVFASAIFATGVSALASYNLLCCRNYVVLLRLSNPVMLGKKAGECAIVLDKENEWHQRLVAARDTLSDVMLKHWVAQTESSSQTGGHVKV